MTHTARGAALIVGAGLMGRWHAHSLRRLSIPIGGVVDPDRERASRLARQVGNAPVHLTLDSALASGACAAAHVCTPARSHVSIVSDLLGAGVHVLCEKPLAESAPETEGLLRHATESRLLLTPVHQFLYQNGFLAVASALRGSGRLLHVDVFAASVGAGEGDAERAEAVAADILPHPLSLLRRLIGASFTSIDWSVVTAGPGEVRATGVWDGATVGILVSMRGRPTRNAVRIVCEGGTWHVDLFHGFAWREGPGVSRSHKIARPFRASARSGLAATTNLARRALSREPAYPGLRTLVSLFWEAVRSGGPSPISVEESLDVARARDALMAAA